MRPATSISLAQDVESAMSDLTLRVFRGALNSASEAHGLANIAEAIKHCVAVTLARELRAQNAKLLHDRMPNELWCMIWAHLPMRDCVAVSHVCHYWRELALETPRLWCELDFFSSRHASSCECDRCNALTPDDICPRCRADFWMGATNLNLITNIVGRSLSLPLHLTVTAPVTHGDTNVTAHLGYMLQNDVERLVALTINTDDPFLGHEVIRSFPSLPALRSLVSRHIRHPDVEGIFLELVALPALQVLDLPRRLLHSDFPDLEAASFSFPSLRTLHVIVTHPEALDQNLAACPTLNHLSVALHNSFPHRTHDLLYQAIRERAARVDSLTVFYSPASQEDVALFMFHDTSRAKLTLILGERGRVSEAPLPPFHIFSDLIDSTEFRCWRALDDGIVTCLALQEGGHAATRRCREIRTRKRDHLAHVWQSINAAALLSIVVDLDVWMDLAPVPALPAVQRIDFIVRSRFGETVHPQGNCAEWSPSLPMLHEVRFISANDNDIAFDAAELEIFLGALRSEVTPVPVVSFKRVSVIRALDPATISLQA